MKLLSCLCVAVLAFSASEAMASNLPKSKVAHHKGGGLFSNWCAYNCYRVSKYARPPLGRYHYSQYAYDQDLPFPYRFDRDATVSDNVLAMIHPYTGEYFIRAFERRW